MGGVGCPVPTFQYSIVRVFQYASSRRNVSRFRIPGDRLPRPRPHKGRLFRRVRKRRVKYITVLPSLITIFNGAFGFIAIALASKETQSEPGHWSYFAMAGYMVLLAMFADMLDGRLARMSQSTSSFGGQLDSLCDMISFGVAPAFVMLKLVEYKLELEHRRLRGFSPPVHLAGRVGVHRLCRHSPGALQRGERGERSGPHELRGPAQPRGGRRRRQPDHLPAGRGPGVRRSDLSPAVRHAGRGAADGQPDPVSAPS